MKYILPALIFLIVSLGLVRKVAAFEHFTRGAKEGAMTILNLVPSLVGLITAIGVLRASGALEILGNILQTPLSYLGVPEELLPLVMVRPMSGSAALAVVRDILENCGPDSYAGRVACVMMGSSETVLYTMAVYTQGTPVKKLPGVIPAALIANLFACIFALLICKIL
ncbi:MAG: spore maturation protein [Clostridia bacterium]|jgi:spore maturation protein B|nr:spore maturation protein [Clostridia bacterium]